MTNSSKSKNFKKGIGLLMGGTAIVLLSLYLKKNPFLVSNLYLLVFVIGFLTTLKGASCLGESKEYIKKNPQIISVKELIQNYFGRGLLVGLFLGILLNQSLIRILISMSFLEILSLTFYHFYYKTKARG